jgi:hypothetical protein
MMYVKEISDARNHRHSPNGLAAQGRSVFAREAARAEKKLRNEPNSAANDSHISIYGVTGAVFPGVSP